MEESPMSTRHADAPVRLRRLSASSLRAALAFAIGDVIAWLVGFQLGAAHAAERATREPAAPIVGEAPRLAPAGPSALGAEQRHERIPRTLRPPPRP